MGKKLLIDLEKLREYKNIPVEGIWKRKRYALSFKTIRELATFQYTCRKCEKAPCVEACPVKALEKDDNGMVMRSLYRCVRCKSCVVICPFGTMMDDLFAAKTAGRRFLNLTGEKELIEFAQYFPDEVASIVEREEDPAKHIYSFNEDILIKEITWHSNG